MFINLQELELRTVRFELDIPPGEIEFDGTVKQASALHTEGKAELLSGTLGEVRLVGRLSLKIEATCDRCLEPLSFPVEKSFDLFYRPAEVAGSGGEEELEEGETEVAYYEGDRLDLNEILREIVLLALPMQLVCSEACKGICPSCGQNRNLQDCNCSAPAVDDRWSKLKSFRAEIGPQN